MKKVLITATELHMYKFWLPHIQYLYNKGYQVSLACSIVSNKWDLLCEKVKQIGPISIKSVPLKRSPVSLTNIKGFKALKQIIEGQKFDVIITNEPVMGMITRFAAKRSRKLNTKVIYIAHGFHFWKGAPFLNWAVFYPIERIASHFTDVLVTMNQEDYRLAKAKMKAKKVSFIHGIGVDLSVFSRNLVIREMMRERLKVTSDEFLIFSASELIPRKNLRVGIDAIKLLNNKKIKFFIRGEGVLFDELHRYIQHNELSENVFLLGFGKDIAEMNSAADICLFPSLQEGLPVALLESVACRLPVLCSDVRGNNDIVQNGRGGYLCSENCAESYAQLIDRMYHERSKLSELTQENNVIIKQYDIKNVKQELLAILESC